MNSFYETPILLPREELAHFLFADPARGAQKFWIAASGGLDSMVLMDLFASWARTQNLPVEILHVNYGLRGEESEGDAVFVERQAKLRSLPFRVLKVEAGSQPSTGIQNWARHIRYDWFARTAGVNDKVLLAHHLDDHVETILMRIMRGSGLSGLEGMKCEQGIYWRPLLKLSQKVLQEIAAREKIPHREDSSNAKLDYSRNRLRKIILPEMEEMFPGAGRNLKDLAEAGQEWSRFYGKIFADYPEPTTPGAWRDLGFHPASQWLIHKAKMEQWAKDMNRRWLESVYKGLIEGASTVLQLDPEHQVRLQQGRVSFERKAKSVSPRWQQYGQELTRAGLSALLSSDTQLEALVDAGLEQPEKDEKIRRESKALKQPPKPQK
ncbi:MAG: tRNA lysidine(34) synthetase TilS [Chitinophagaceae bacterium]|nr:tRNA lysidine(34) synthetase TilS [Oligoflexus sp.]